MPSLVIELQLAALNPDRKVADLLRMALVVARKLGVADFEAWVNAELNGYEPDTECPKYRQLRGDLKAWDPHQGWISVVFRNSDIAEIVAKNPNTQRISELESVLAEGANADGPLILNYPAAAEAMLMKSFQIPRRPALHIGRSQIQGLVDAVRNKVLDWSLRLEAAGVMGENMSFSDEEKARGRQETATYQIQNQTIIHGMSQSQVQQGAASSLQTYVQTSVDMAAINSLILNIRDAINSLTISESERAEVLADLATLEAQKASPKPRQGVIRETLHSLRTILEGAVGGAAGNALPAILDQLRQLLT